MVGAAIGSQVANPFLVVVFAFLSHFVLDSLPHWEYTIDHIKKRNHSKRFFRDLGKVFVDILFGFSLLLLVLSNFSDKDMSLAVLFPLLLGGFFAIVPDLITFTHWQTKYKVLKWPNIIHGPIQPSSWYPNKINPQRIGFIAEVLIIIVAITVLIG